MEKKEVDIRDYLWVILRRKWIVVLIFVACLGSTSLFTVMEKPRYAASSKIMVQSEPPGNIFEGGGFYFWRSPNIENHCQAIKSKSFAEFMVTEFEDEDVEYLKRLWCEDSFKHYIQSAISVSPIKETDAILIKASSPDSGLALILANGVAKGYKAYNMMERRKDITSIREFVGKQLNIVKERLEEGEEQLKEFKKNKGIITLSDEAREVVEKGREVAYMIQRVKSEHAENENKLRYLNEIIEKEKGKFSGKLEDVSSPALSNLKVSLDELELERMNLLLQGYSENDERIKALNKEIEELRRKIRVEAKAIFEEEGIIDPMDRLRSIYEDIFLLKVQTEGTKKKLEVLESIKKKYDQELKKLPEIEQELANLQRSIETDRKIYSLLSEKYEEARIEEAGRLSLIKVMSLASHASRVAPKRKRNMILGGLVGFMLAIGVAFLMEYLDKSVKDINSLSKELEVPVLGVIPFLSINKPKFLWQKKKDQVRGIQTIKLKGAVAEAFKLMHTSIKYLVPGKDKKCIVVTSPGPKEGKTTIVINLGRTFAKAGLRTLVVDADLRNPQLHRYLKSPRSPGLTDLIVDNLPLNEAIQKCGDNLYFLPTGKLPPSPSDFLESSEFVKLMEELKQEFDAILIDSVPVLGIPDAVVLSKKVDGVIMGLWLGRTEKDAVLESLRMLKETGGNVLGLVGNAAVPEHHYGYKYYYYSYYTYGNKKRRS